jgi:hypothetical protein
MTAVSVWSIPVASLGCRSADPLGAEKKENTERIRLSSAALDLALKASGRVDVFRRLDELAAAVSPQLDAQQVAAALLARELGQPRSVSALLSAPDNERFLKLMESA